MRMLTLGMIALAGAAVSPASEVEPGPDFRPEPEPEPEPVRPMASSAPDRERAPLSPESVARKAAAPAKRDRRAARNLGVR